MKKILLTLIAAVAVLTTVCSTTNKASAAEGQGEATPTASDVYNNNQFKGFTFNPLFDGGEPTYSNFIKLGKGRSIYFSIRYDVSEFGLSYEPEDYSNKGSLIFAYECLDANFKQIVDNTFSGGQYIYLSDYTFIEEVQAFQFNGVLVKNAFNELPDAEYISLLPQASVYKKNGDGLETIDLSNDRITDIHMEVIEETNNLVTGFRNLQFSYNTQSNVTWKYNDETIESSFYFSKLPISSVNTLTNSFTAKTEDGHNMTISCGNFDGQKIHDIGETYRYIFKAEDKLGNYDWLFVTFVVLDTEEPLISGPTEVKVNCMIPTDISVIKNALKVSDNFDSSENITISVKYDYYTSNYDKPGMYYICFVAMDTSGNSSEFVVKITVQDTTPPIFYDTNTDFVLNKKLEVMKSVDSVFLLSDITSLIKAIDDVDGEVKITVSEDGYTGNGEKAGQYIIRLKATDKSGNVSYTTVRINVVEAMPTKTIILNQEIIIVEQDVRLNKQDFHDILKVAGYYSPEKYGLSGETTFYTKVDDELYKPHYSELGEYLVALKITSPSGIDYDDTLIVKVVESRTANSLVDNPAEPDGIIISILKWIWNLLVGIFNWFAGLFK